MDSGSFKDLGELEKAFSVPSMKKEYNRYADFFHRVMVKFK